MFLPRKHLLIKTFLTMIAFGLIGLSGCRDQRNDTNSSAALPPCENPRSAFKLMPFKYDSGTGLGWHVSGPSFSEQVEKSLMGKYDNQIVIEQPIQGDINFYTLNLDVSGSKLGSVMILDSIWYKGSIEISRSSSSVELKKNLQAKFSVQLTVPPTAERVMLIARPWRQEDGILTIGEGEIIACLKNSAK